ncbi:MAG: hypothetical protein JSW11_14460 [Candidatus Heimdallarchaeota archaeon]|nr:MAG: hypothetical protein JSW11_14460 [Candidatus Heimdallarchaeota archaeon]
MDDVKIILSFLWVAVVLCYLYGDVFSILAGDFKLGEIDGKPLTETMVLVMAVIMIIPIIMIVLTLLVDDPVSRGVNIIVAVIYFGFNLFSIRGYPLYEKFTLLVSMGFNLVIVYIAWSWVI